MARIVMLYSRSIYAVIMKQYCIISEFIKDEQAYVASETKQSQLIVTTVCDEFSLLFLFSIVPSDAPSEKSPKWNRPVYYKWRVIARCFLCRMMRNML